MTEKGTQPAPKDTDADEHPEHTRTDISFLQIKIVSYSQLAPCSATMSRGHAKVVYRNKHLVGDWRTVHFIGEHISACDLTAIIKIQKGYRQHGQDKSDFVVSDEKSGKGGSHPHHSRLLVVLCVARRLVLLATVICSTRKVTLNGMIGAQSMARMS